jgi:ABC-type lipoprotein release transport system permease subunit
MLGASPELDRLQVVVGEKRFEEDYIRRSVFQIKSLVEGLFIGALSCAIAVPLSLPMSMVVGNGFGMIMFQTPIVFVTDPFGIAIWLAVTFVLSALASLYPAWRATRTVTSEALAYG